MRKSLGRATSALCICAGALSGVGCYGYIEEESVCSHPCFASVRAERSLNCEDVRWDIDFAMSLTDFAWPLERQDHCAAYHIVEIDVKDVEAWRDDRLGMTLVGLYKVYPYEHRAVVTITRESVALAHELLHHIDMMSGRDSYEGGRMSHPGWNTNGYNRAAWDYAYHCRWLGGPLQ